ncbi:MAG TPA: DUF998 domain-containing protein [Pseudonocardiaceae bacterium]|nr:DUF998 domain-containing protein [Pseudonocardiaceae bacterium]
MSSMIRSYVFLRRSIGMIGMALPVVLVVGYLFWPPTQVLTSISGYYYSPLRGVLVGSMCAVGVFLLSYRGIGIIDDLISNIAAVAAVGLALFPTTPSGPRTVAQQHIGIVHVVCAATFFLMLALFCLVRFPKPDNEVTAGDPRRHRRDLAYYATGSMILLCLLLVVVTGLLPATEPAHPLLILETVAIFSFGVSWFVKGTEPLPADLLAARAATPPAARPEEPDDLPDTTPVPTTP